MSDDVHPSHHTVVISFIHVYICSRFRPEKKTVRFLLSSVSIYRHCLWCSLALTFFFRVLPLPLRYSLLAHKSHSYDAVTLYRQKLYWRGRGQGVISTSSIGPWFVFRSIHISSIFRPSCINSKKIWKIS